jgi:hypothetical protein
MNSNEGGIIGLYAQSLKSWRNEWICLLMNEELKMIISASDYGWKYRVLYQKLMVRELKDQGLPYKKYF